MNEIDNPDALEFIACRSMQDRVMPLFSRVVRLMQKGRIERIDSTGGYPNRLDDAIAKLCGYKDGNDMALNFRDETQATFDLFEHADLDAAYTLFKALEAKRK